MLFHSAYVVNDNQADKVGSAESLKLRCVVGGGGRSAGVATKWCDAQYWQARRGSIRNNFWANKYVLFIRDTLI